MTTPNQPAGRAFPPGGAQGDVLTKLSDENQDIAWAAPGSIGAGGSISATDGNVTVDPATSILFTYGSLTDAGGGVAELDTGKVVTPNGSIDASTQAGVLIVSGAAGDDGAASGIRMSAAGSGHGGAIHMNGGSGAAGQPGGNVVIVGGNGDNDDGGGGASAIFDAGTADPVGPSLHLNGGSATFQGGGNGGNIVLIPGAGDGAGAYGLVVLPHLPTADPLVAGALYSDGAPSAGVPKALMVSGG